LASEANDRNLVYSRGSQPYLCHGTLWEYGETYRYLLRKMYWNAYNSDSEICWVNKHFWSL